MAEYTDPELEAIAAERRVIAEAQRRYTQTEAYHSAEISKYRRWHHYYAPRVDWNGVGDQWPEDLAQRPGKIHITSNIIKPFIDVDARLQAKLPRITLQPLDNSEPERARAEAAEQLQMTWLEASQWELWMQRGMRVKGIYGKAILKPFWNKVERRPDVQLIEQPHNLRIGWGASDFSVMDWALYEHSLSPAEVMRRWPDIRVVDRNPNDPNAPLTIVQDMGDQDDPLRQKEPSILDRQPSDYEAKQIKVWDYWYKRADEVYNCVILQGRYHAVKPTYHRELIDIPYIVIEHEHEPGSPDGRSGVEPLIDVQYELNRLLSQHVQLIVDNLDPAWQIDDDAIPEGSIPKGGEIIAAGDGKKIMPLEKQINTFPIAEGIAAMWNQAHRTSGEGEILFGSPASAQDSGRALAVQIESVINRLDPKRIETYAGLRELLIFWSVMVERLNPSFRGFRPAQVLRGLRRYKIVAPEVTPKDAADHTNNVINKLNAQLSSLEAAMDELGVDSPMDEIKKIADERSTLPLYAGNVQAMAQVGILLLQLQQMGLTLEQIIQGGGVAPASREGANTDLAQRQKAQPKLTESENQQPATGQGGVPPLTATTLVRSTANQESQALNQLASNTPIGG